MTTHAPHLSRRPSVFVHGVAQGQRVFHERCAGCHGDDGRGGSHGPAIVGAPRQRATTRQELRELIRAGMPDAGMPAFPLAAAELNALADYLLALRNGVGTPGASAAPLSAARLASRSPISFAPNPDPGPHARRPGGRKFRRAIDIRTGKVTRDNGDIGGGILGSGLMATAGGLVFYGDGAGAFVAADDREASLEIQHQPALKGPSDGLHGRWEAICRHRQAATVIAFELLM